MASSPRGHLLRTGSNRTFRLEASKPPALPGLALSAQSPRLSSNREREDKSWQSSQVGKGPFWLLRPIGGASTNCASRMVTPTRRPLVKRTDSARKGTSTAERSESESPARIGHCAPSSYNAREWVRNPRNRAAAQSPHIDQIGHCGHKGRNRPKAAFLDNAIRSGRKQVRPGKPPDRWEAGRQGHGSFLHIPDNPGQGTSRPADQAEGPMIQELARQLRDSDNLRDALTFGVLLAIGLNRVIVPGKGGT